MDIGGAVSALPWSSIAGVVTPFAPKIGAVLGTALGGPIGGVIGSIAGRALAGAFGVDATPEAVGQAITNDPKAADKLARLEAIEGERIRQAAAVEIERLQAETEQYRIAAEAGTVQQTNVNNYMKAELQAGVVKKGDSFFHSGWRPLAGQVTVWGSGAFIVQYAIAFMITALTGNRVLLDLISGNLWEIIALLSIPGACAGVTAWGRSYERGKAMESTAPQPQGNTFVTPAAANTNTPSGFDIGDIVGKTIKAVRKR